MDWQQLGKRHWEEDDTAHPQELPKQQLMLASGALNRQRAKAALLQHLKLKHPSKAARSITRRSQQELQELYKATFGEATHSNNNGWLRKKLLEVLDVPVQKYLDAVKSGNRRRARPKKKTAASGEGGAAEGPSAGALEGPGAGVSEAGPQGDGWGQERDLEGEEAAAALAAVAAGAGAGAKPPPSPPRESQFSAWTRAAQASPLRSGTLCEPGAAGVPAPAAAAAAPVGSHLVRASSTAHTCRGGSGSPMAVPAASPTNKRSLRELLAGGHPMAATVMGSRRRGIPPLAAPPAAPGVPLCSHVGMQKPASGPNPFLHAPPAAKAAISVPDAASQPLVVPEPGALFPAAGSGGSLQRMASSGGESMPPPFGLGLFQQSASGGPAPMGGQGAFAAYSQDQAPMLPSMHLISGAEQPGAPAGPGMGPLQQRQQLFPPLLPPAQRREQQGMAPMQQPGRTLLVASAEGTLRLLEAAALGGAQQSAPLALVQQPAGGSNEAAAQEQLRRLLPVAFTAGTLRMLEAAEAGDTDAVNEMAACLTNCLSSLENVPQDGGTWSWAGQADGGGAYQPGLVVQPQIRQQPPVPPPLLPTPPLGPPAPAQERQQAQQPGAPSPAQSTHPSKPVAQWPLRPQPQYATGREFPGLAGPSGALPAPAAVAAAAAAWQRSGGPGQGVVQEPRQGPQYFKENSLQASYRRLMSANYEPLPEVAGSTLEALLASHLLSSVCGQGQGW